MKWQHNAGRVHLRCWYAFVTVKDTMAGVLRSGRGRSSGKIRTEFCQCGEAEPCNVKFPRWREFAARHCCRAIYS